MREAKRIVHRPLPMGAIGMLALVAFVELVLVRNKFIGDKSASWSFAHAASEREVTRGAMLFFGDSMVKFGVLPRVLERQSGREAFNLAVFDGPPAASLALFRSALRSGRVPSAIVLGAMPHQLARSTRDPRLRAVWADLLGPVDAVRLGFELHDQDLPCDTLLGRILPSFHARDELRAVIDAAFKGKPRSSRGIVSLYTRNWNANRGAHVLAPRSEPGACDPNNDELFPNVWRAQANSVEAVNILIAEAGARNIPVYWLISPLHPDAQNRIAEMGIASAYDDYLHALLARFPAVTVLDGRTLGLGAADFVDAVHLDRDGALRLSMAVAAAMERAKPRTRWVPLGLPSGIATDAPLEDMEQSRMALSADRVRR